MKTQSLLCSVFVALLGISGGAQAPQTVPYDHIHLTAPDLKAKGVTFTSGPQPKPNQFGHRTGYVEAPGGVRIELVEHADCAWGKSGS